MKKAGSLVFGLLLGAAILVLGYLITGVFETGVPLLVSVIMLPVLIFTMWSRNRAGATGVLIAFLAIATFYLYLLLSNQTLH